jgi:hypothetical protein
LGTTSLHELSAKKANQKMAAKTSKTNNEIGYAGQLFVA